MSGQCEPNGFCSFADDACASHRSYGDLSGSLSHTCVGNEPIDASVHDGSTIDPDVLLSDALSCYGSSNGLVRECFDTPPAMPTTLTAGQINTDSSALCEKPLGQSPYCAIVGGSISLPAGTTVTAIGSRPLVLIASTTISISGTLDVASHRGGQTGAGSDPAAGCDAGTAPGTVGGGAGGSFAAKGGNGGQGTGGTAGNAATITLRGGCVGQAGNGGGAGAGGRGGGAIYVVAGTSITIAATGVINASGAGGVNAVPASSGGGGGGSGGLIGLDAPSITNAGTLSANGGGGGEGSGGSSTGSPGQDPVGTAPGLAGANGSGNGGDGGNGAGGATLTGTAGNAGANSGGGGGGGAGAIKLYPMQTLGGLVSPPPT